MASITYNSSLLKGSIYETNFVEDIVTECLTASCSECKGEYVNLVLSRKFVCQCKCHGGEHKQRDSSDTEGTHHTNRGVNKRTELKND